MSDKALLLAATLCTLAMLSRGGDGVARPLGVESPYLGEEMRTVEVTRARVARGKDLFATCAACHGPAGEGKRGMGPRLRAKSFQEAASDALLIRTITTGRAGTAMVSWGGLSDGGDPKSGRLHPISE